MTTPPLLTVCSIFLALRWSSESAMAALSSSTTRTTTTTTTMVPSNMWSPIKYEAPDDCQWWLRESGGGGGGGYAAATGEEVALACNLRTINSEFDTSNFSMIPSEHTISLKITCNSELMSRSSLGERSFAHLSRLRELILDYCKMGKWPAGALAGLRDLRNLTVRTRNTDWPAISLELSAESFEPVRQLERLDLSTNNIWSLPENVFCPLTNLIVLNVSENRLQDIVDLNFRERAFVNPEEEELERPTGNCNGNVRVLDASHNHFVLVPGAGFSALKQLQELRLHGNEISVVADRALAGLKNLKCVDLSSNKIVKLPLDLFVECAESIGEIYLQNNSISVLSPRLFANLSQLHSLDLSANQLTSAWMNNETFSGLIRLVLLNLSRNQITVLDPTLFHDLYTLQILNLERNRLETIPANTFNALYNLHTLALSYNRLKHLAAYALNGLNALSLLSLDNNRLESIDEKAFRNCTGLQDLNISGNRFTEVPTALKEMRVLKTLDLGENLITSLEKPGFRGMTNLYGLRLIANQISVVGRKSFVELRSLQILNLSQNRIKTIEKGTFAANTKLEAIRVDGNVLTVVDEVFKEVTSLLWLNISDNKLRELDYSMFPPNLRWLDVHSNSIEQLTNVRTVKPLIQQLDVSFNLLTHVTAASIPDSVELLFLNDNRITFVEPHTFAGKANLSRVDLYANNIENLDLVALQLAPVAEDRALPQFYIGGNPFVCDCTMEWLQRINKLEIRQHPVIMDIDGVYCRLIYDRERDFVPLTRTQPSQFLCPYKSHCYTLCQCCPFDACDCEMNCPTGCVCFHDQSWSANIVDCARANHTRMPSKIPMDATVLYLDGNDFVELASHSFIGRKNLRHLYVNSSNVAVIHNHTFSGIGKLLTLHLEHNRIQVLRGLEFASLDRLEELYLHDNRIFAIDARTFARLRNLRTLRLDSNRLHRFEVWQLVVANPYLSRITVAGNPWSCDCQFVNELRLWIQENYAKIGDIDTIACSMRGGGGNDSSSLGSFLKHANNTSSCLTFFGASLAENRMLRDYLPFLLLTSVVFVVLTVVTMAVFMYKKELHVCLYTKCGPLRSCYGTTRTAGTSFGGGGGDDDDDGGGDHERLYDAYVIYCVADEDFVARLLCPALEDGEAPYRLCLHYRDFNVMNASYATAVVDAVVEAAECSRRVLVVLSSNFVRTEWNGFEHKSALRQVLRDRRNKVGFVLIGDVTVRDLDADLRPHLKGNACLLRWGDNLFWQELNYFLPSVKRTAASTFIISSRNATATAAAAANVYATPFNFYNNGGATITDHRTRNLDKNVAVGFPPLWT